ncbi:MAG: VWA domain-containing protein [Alphaproteobacteria bacterium]
MPRSRLVGLTIAVGLAAGLNSVPAHGANHVVVVFDASNSMNSRFEKSRRIIESKQALIDAARLTGVNPGLVVFGHRQKQSCRDIETIIPANSNNPALMASALAGVRAMGVTPLASALRRAATDAAHRNQRARVVVIADGAGVKSCRIDTCATAKELKNEAVNLSFSVIAIAPKPEEIASLRCIAQVTGGTYQEVRDIRSLRNAVAQALGANATRAGSGAIPPPRRKPRVPVAISNAPPPRPKPADLQTAPLQPDTAASANGGFNTTVFAPTSAGEAPVVMAPAPAIAPVAASETTMAPSAPGKPAAPGNSTTMAPSPPSQPGVKTTEAAPPPPPSPPTPAVAGPKTPPRTTILVKRPPATVKSPNAVKKPKLVQPTPTAAATGAMKLQAFVIENSKPIPAGMLWQVFAAKADNTRGKLVARSSDPAPELKLPVGAYEVVAIFGQATSTEKIQVTKGKTATGTLVLNAGGLQLIPLVDGTALTSGNITNVIYRSDDPRNPVVKDAASGAVIYLNAGIFKIVSRYGNVNAIARADVVVQRGKLTQAKINHRAGPAEFKLVDKAGGPALAGTSWEIFDVDGRTLKRSEETTPRYILAEGKYTVSVARGGKSHRRDFLVTSGRTASVEVLVK